MRPFTIMFRAAEQTAALAADQRGFTLWELLVAVLVVGIVLSLGVPNFLSLTRDSHMTSAVNSWVSGLHLARTEAVKRGVPVTICGSSDPLAAAPVCDGGRGGYFAFADVDDTNADGFPDGDGTHDGGEAILFQRDAPNDSVSFFSDGDDRYIAYGSNGFLTSYPALGRPATTLLFCDDRGNRDAGNGDSSARVVIVSRAGRPQLLRTTDAVTAAAASTGGSCS
jgi:type IV fimbrial biogenesis protein FimT